MLQELKINGTTICILSRGKEHQIHYLLKLVNLRQYFDAIYGNEDNFRNGSKTMLIINMIRNGKGVVYYDDDRSEHDQIIGWLRDQNITIIQDGNYDKAFMKPTYCYFTGLVKNGRGLSIDTIRSIPASVASLLTIQGGNKRRNKRSNKQSYCKAKTRRSRK